MINESDFLILIFIRVLTVILSYLCFFLLDNFRSETPVILPWLACILGGFRDNVNIEEDEMVHIYLGGLSHKYVAFQTTITTRENLPTFIDLQFYIDDGGKLVAIEEHHVRWTEVLHARWFRSQPEPREHGEEWS